MANKRNIERDWARAVQRGDTRARRNAEQAARKAGLPDIAARLAALTESEAKRAAARTRS